MEMSVFTTNLQHIVNRVNLYIYDNKNLVPFRRLRY